MSALPRILLVGEEPPPLSRPAAQPTSIGKQPESKKASTRKAAGERFGSINAFLDTTMASLSPCERAVWLLLWRDTRPNGLACTSQADLARRAGASERAVRSALRELERRGLVVVVRRGRLQSGPSHYRVQPLAQRD
jgi:hypothetical protein